VDALSDCWKDSLDIAVAMQGARDTCCDKMQQERTLTPATHLFTPSVRLVYKYLQG